MASLLLLAAVIDAIVVLLRQPLIVVMA